MRAICQALFPIKDTYLPVNQILSSDIWKAMYDEYPRLKKSWSVQVIMGDAFDPSETNYKDQVPASTEYVVYKFKKQVGNKDGDFLRLFHCKF